MMNVRTFALAAASLLAVAGPAQAATIVDTGPPPASLRGVIYGGSVGGSAGFAGRFTLSVATAINSIQFYGAAIGNNTGNIRADGNTPGASLFTATIGGTDVRVNQWVGLSGLNWVLSAGSYWVTFESPTSADAFREAINSPNPVARQAEQSAGVWSRNPPYSYALRVEGTEVTGAVPEPATWAMMIVGFGMAGAAMRRRQRLAGVRRRRVVMAV